MVDPADRRSFRPTRLRSLRSWCARALGLAAGGRCERDVADELEAHIQMHVDDRVREGASPDQARRDALLALGGVEQTRVLIREARTTFFDTLRHDVVYALRMMRRSPVVTLVAIVSLGLGIGANTSVFTVLNGVVLRPLPFETPDRLCMVWETFRTVQRGSVSYPNLADWRARTHAFESLAGFLPKSYTLTGRGEPERVLGARVTAGFFDTLRVRPALGRLFQSSDDAPGAENVAVLTHAAWQNRFGRDSGVIGTALTIDRTPFRVVGVLPADFEFGVDLDEAEIWTPAASDAQMFQIREWPRLRVVGRLRPGVDLEQARAEMVDTQRFLAKAYPKTSANHGVRVVPLHEEVVGRLRPVLQIMLGAVGLVLLAACANVANLLLARGVARGREFAIRGALGASRGRVLRQLLTESVILGLLGGAAGFVLASASLQTLVALLPAGTPRIDTIRIDPRVWLFSGLLSLAASLAFGLLPAVRGSGSTRHLSFGDDGTRLLGGGRQASRSGLVVAQVALAVTLLAGASLLIQSMLRLTRVAPGFRTDNLLTFRLNLGWDNVLGDRARADLYTRILERLRTLPGVESVSASSTLPMGPVEGYRFTIEGRPPLATHADWPEARLASISPSYFDTLGIPLRRGRRFDDRDQRANRPGAVIVNEALAAMYFRGVDPIGQRITSEVDINDNDPKTFEIVGVVGNDRAFGLDMPERPTLYSPYQQQTFPYMSFALRTAVAPESLAGAVRSAVAEITASEAIFQMATMEALVRRSPGMASRRFPMLAVSVFAVMALVLAAAGLFAVIDFAVVQRTREIGLRMSLGARPRDVLTMVVVQGLRLVGLGIAIGLASVLLTGRLLGSLLYDTRSWDPVALGTVTALLVVVAGVACSVPARRASRVDPMTSLR